MKPTLKYFSLTIVLLLSPLFAVQQASASPAINASSPPIPKETRVTLNTTLGDIVIELYNTRAPITVANFVGYVNSGHYKGTVFHRVIPGFMAQGVVLLLNCERNPPYLPFLTKLTMA